MRGIIYQAWDVAKKLSKYQTLLSQVYVRIFHKSTKTEISIKNIWDIWRTKKKKKTQILWGIKTGWAFSKLSLSDSKPKAILSLE